MLSTRASSPTPGAGSASIRPSGPPNSPSFATASLAMRSSGLEPPRGKLPTRPSTLRVYQFRHERSGGEYSPGPAAGMGPRGREPPASRASCVRPGAALQCEHMFVSAPANRNHRGRQDMDLTKRQQEIFDFIRNYSAKYGYPPTVRDIGKAVGLASSSTVHAHLANLEKIGLLRRDPPSRGRSSCSTGRSAAPWTASAGWSAPKACRCSARWPPDSRSSPRRTSRNTCPCPSIAGGEEGDYLLRIRGESMKERGHPRRRLRRRPPAGHRQRRRHRRRPARRGGHRQALLPRTRPHPPAARERRHGADPQQGGQGARTRVVGPAQREVLSAACVARARSDRRRYAERRLGAASPSAAFARPRRAALPWSVQAQAAAGASQEPFEESPDITGQGGRAIDPGKPAGKCHRNKPPKSAVPRERRNGKGEMVR